MHDENINKLSRILEEPTNQISDWLLCFLIESKTHPLTFLGEPSYLLQLRDLFLELSVPQQTKFRAAVIATCEKWVPNVYGLSILEDLALLCAYTKNYDALDNLRVLIDILLDILDLENDNTVSILFGVIGGFSPSKEVMLLLERYYYSTHYKYIAQLFLSLCECDPNNYPKYIPRLYEAVRNHSMYFRMDYIVAEFVRIVGLRTIAAEYYLIKDGYKKWFLDILCRSDWSPAEIVISESSMFIKTRRSYGVLGSAFAENSQLHLLYYPWGFDVGKYVDDSLNIIKEKENSISYNPVQFLKQLVRVG